MVSSLGQLNAEFSACRYAPAIILRHKDDNALAEYYDRIARSLSGLDVTSPLGLAQLSGTARPGRAARLGRARQYR